MKYNERPFGSVSVIVIGDLYHIKPVQDGYVFQPLQSNYGPLATNSWTEHFSMYELSEIMRQNNTKCLQKF